MAVLAGVIFTMILGFLWYGPLFGKRWMAMIGKTEDEIEASNSMFLTTAVAALIGMTALALVVGAFGATSFLDGVIAAIVGWALAAVATYVYSSFEGPPLGVWFLFAAYQLVAWAIMGGVYAVWK